MGHHHRRTNAADKRQEGSQTVGEGSAATVEYLDAKTGKWFPVGWGMPPGSYEWMLAGRADGTYRVTDEDNQ